MPPTFSTFTELPIFGSYVNKKPTTLSVCSFGKALARVAPRGTDVPTTTGAQPSPGTPATWVHSSEPSTAMPRGTEDAAGLASPSIVSMWTLYLLILIFFFNNSLFVFSHTPGVGDRAWEEREEWAFAKLSGEPLNSPPWLLLGRCLTQKKEASTPTVKRAPKKIGGRLDQPLTKQPIAHSLLSSQPTWGRVF